MPRINVFLIKIAKTKGRREQKRKKEINKKKVNKKKVNRKKNSSKNKNSPKLVIFLLNKKTKLTPLQQPLVCP